MARLKRNRELARGGSFGDVQAVAGGRLLVSTTAGRIYSFAASGSGKRIQGKDRAQVLKEANRRLASAPKDLEALSAIGGVACPAMLTAPTLLRGERPAAVNSAEGP